MMSHGILVINFISSGIDRNSFSSYNSTVTLFYILREENTEHQTMQE